MNKPAFKKGQKFILKDEEIQILLVYPAGHKYTQPDAHFYLIHSTDGGEDVIPESRLKERVNRPTNLHRLFIELVINFAHIVTITPQTKEAFINKIKSTYDMADPKTAIFLGSIKMSEFDTIRLNDTRDALLFNQ